jgi:hypothetical protein
VGTTKAIPVARFNGRIYCVIKNDSISNTQEFKTQIAADLYITRNDANYLFSYGSFKKRITAILF